MSATALAKRWIYARASTDAQLVAAAPGGVHDFEIPQGTAQAAVVFRSMSAIDLNAVGTQRAWTALVVQIMAVIRQRSTIALAPAAARIDALFHGQTAVSVAATAPLSGGTIIASYREQEISLGVRAEDGEFTTYLGGIYRIIVQED